MDGALRASDFFDLTGFAHRALFDGTEHVWEALGRLADYLRAAAPAAIAGEVSPGAWIVGAVAIGAGTVVEPGAYIHGPCLIGRDCEVRHGAYVRGSVVVGDRCVIGHTTEVKGSIFLDGAKAGHFAYVGDSILGRDVNLGAGTKLANLRLGGEPIRVKLGELWLETGRRKLGAILGDGVETGCNSVTNPGTLLGPGARLLPCRTARGYWPAGARID
jgi:NDP-sugar pyrophosphorylase family protein